MFSQTELKLIRVTAILACAVAFASLIILIFWIFARVLAHFYSLLLPLAIAGVLALVLEPIVRVMTKGLGMARLPAVVVLTLLIVLSLIPLFWLIVPTAVEQSRELGRLLPDLASRAQDSIDARLPGAVNQVSGYLETLEMGDFTEHAEALFSRVGDFAGLAIGLGFVPLFLFFMLLSGNRIANSGKEILSVFSADQQKEISYLTRLFINYVTAFFQGQLIIALIMGLLLALGFSVIGLQAGIVLGILLGLLNIVPFLGVIVGLVIVTPIAWLQPDGGLSLVGLVILVFLVVQLIESWLLTPRIMSERSGLHPALVVISLFFWGIVFGGIIGMLLAVPLSAFLLALWKHAKAHYLTNIMTPSLIPSGSHAIDETAFKQCESPRNADR
ncbi:MAG: AI-2E family transporter [Wenzhouxiangella sp.]